MDEDDVTSNDDFQGYFPTSFGKQGRTSNVNAQINQSKRKIIAEVKDQKDGSANKTTERDDTDDSGSDSDSDAEDDEFPITHELVIKTHDRPVTTITIDPSGSRLVTGSNDCTFRLHDFASMTPTTVRAFKTVDPSVNKTSANVETHPVLQALFNPLSPGQILIITAQPQAKLYSRDGEIISTFVKGDMYLRDMHNTKGHISQVTSGAWHPTNRNLCVTAGTDSTLRIWDIKNPREQKEVIVHKSRAAGSAGRTRMTTVGWGSSASGGNDVLVAAAIDGSLAIWSGEGPHNRPVADIRNAHNPDTWTGGLDISPDGRMVVTRGGDDMIKLWDVRKFKQPVTTLIHPSTSSQYQTTNIRFSPNGQSIITGSATGHLHILSLALRPEVVTPVTPESPLITAQWHDKLNQIITGSANAETRVLYNPDTSHGGAKLVMSKAPKRRHIDDDPNLTTDLSQGLAGDALTNPGNNQSATNYAARHPTVGLTASGRSRDPRRPHVPATTPFAKSQPDEKHIRQNIPLSSMRDEDPREALLKYAEKAQNDPMFTNAWKHTQPKTIYADLSDEDEDEPDKKKARR